MAEERSSSYICAEDISVGYHNLPLIQKINLHVNRGEILTLIGPNGAGKSTILKSLIGQLKLVKGAVWLDGTSMGTMKEKEIALRMSVMMTGRVKTERMTCQEVVSMGRYPYTGKMGILTEKDWQVVYDSLKLVQGLDTLRIALGKKLNISEKKLFEKEQQVYLFLICLTGKNSRDEESLRQGMGKVGSFLSSMSKTCIGETLPDGTGMFLAPFSDGEAFTDAMYDFSIFLTFLSENEEINFYVGAQPLKESRDLPDCVKEAYDHICLLDRIGAKRGICTFDNRLLVELLGTLHQNEYSIVLGNQALQKLLDHDRYNHTGYVHTIRIYLAHNCNATKTAEHLYIHRHTLMKRLQNISALCGINFTDYYMRVYMSLAILIHDYFTY